MKRIRSCLALILQNVVLSLTEEVYSQTFLIPRCYVSLACIFIVLGYKTSYGQGMTPVTTTIKTPYGNVPHTYYVHSMNNYYNNQNTVSLKHEFTIILKNDSIFKVKARINFEESGKNFITFKDRGGEAKVYPADTKLIVRPAGEGRVLKGIPADSCWLFLVDKGAINRYSFLAETGTAYITAIQHGDDNPIVPLTKENLMAIVSGDPKATKHASKNNLIKAISVFNQNRFKERNNSSK